MQPKRLLRPIHDKPPQSNKNRGRINFDIALAAAASTIPVLGLAVTLVVIIYHNRLEHSSNQASVFNNTLADESGVYYINFSATRLTTVASWASSAGFFLPGSIMSLYWYRIAAFMQQKSQTGNTMDLPTPYQYSLLLALRSGGLPALWEWLTHRFFSRRQRQNPLVSRAGSVLTLVILIGIVIAAADTWLHVTTETVDFDQITPNLVSTQQYGRQLPQHCALGTINGTKHSCAIEVPPHGPDYLINPSEMYQVLNDQSTNNKVLTTDFAGQRFSYLAPSVTPLTLDFEATTIGSHSECQSATERCHANSSGYYRCSTLFNSTTSDWYLSRANGNIISLGIFPDSNWTITNYTSLPQTFYTISEVTILVANNSGSGVSTVTLPNGGRGFFVSCTTSFFNLTYTSKNGSIAAQPPEPITDPNLVYSLAEINIQGRSGYAEGQILGGALTAFHQNTASAANEAFASQYDATFLAAAASVIENVLSIAEQTRNTLLVARVKTSALLALVATLLLSALLGMFMTFLALSHGLPHGQSHDLNRKHHVATSILDPGSGPESPLMEDVFDEYVRAGRTDRLGILGTKQGDWSYVCCVPEPQSPKVLFRKTPELKTPEPQSPDRNIRASEHGVFGIPLVRIESAGGSISGPMSDVSDEDSLSEASDGREVSGQYQAL